MAHGFEVRLQCNAEQDNCIPQPANSTVLNAPQDTVGPPGCLATLLTHVQLVFEQDPQIPFSGAALQHPITQIVCMYSQGCPFPGAESGVCSR